MRRAAALSVLVAGLLAACGGGDDAGSVLEETAENLGEVESGRLELSVLVDPEGGGSDEFGFELRGPFSLRSGNKLPVARLTYTQIAAGRRASATFISTGAKAYVAVGGSTYELPPDEVDDLRGAADELHEGEGLGELSIGDWFREAELSEENAGGVQMDRVRGNLDTVNVANDLLALARDLGRSDLETIQGRSARQLAEAARSATFELDTGRDDRLLRRLKLDVDLGFDVPKDLERALGTVGAHVTFDLGIEQPNEPVSVPPPSNPRPYEELSSGR